MFRAEPGIRFEKLQTGIHLVARTHVVVDHAKRLLDLPASRLRAMATAGGATMKIISFIEGHQRDVIDEILQHCGLWEEDLARGPPAQELAMN